jgi:hypothetical protein
MNVLYITSSNNIENMCTNYFIEGEHYLTIEEVKEILIPKGHEFNKGREPESFEVLQTYDDKDLGDGIIMGRLKNLIIIKTKTIEGKIRVTSYSTNPKSTFTAHDLNQGLIDRGYNVVAR